MCHTLSSSSHAETTPCNHFHRWPRWSPQGSRVTFFPSWRSFHLHVPFVSRLIVIASWQMDLQRHRLACPWSKKGMTNPDWHRVSASALADSAICTSPVVRSPTVRCRVMDLTSREDGFLASCQDLQLNTAINTMLELHPRTDISLCSNLVIGC